MAPGSNAGRRWEQVTIRQVRNGRVGAMSLVIAVFMATGMLVPDRVSGLQARTAANPVAATWRTSTSTMNDRVTWSALRDPGTSRIRFGLAARRSLVNGGWDWTQVDIARPIGSGGWKSRTTVHSVVRYEPARRRVRLITGIQPSAKVADWLWLQTGYYVHIARAPGDGLSVIARGIRVGARARMSPRTTLMAVLAHGERPGGMKFDFILRRGT